MFAKLKSPSRMWLVSVGLILIPCLRDVSCIFPTSTMEITSHGAESTEHISASGEDMKPIADLAKQGEESSSDDSRFRNTLAESISQEQPAQLADLHGSSLEAIRVSDARQGEDWFGSTSLGGSTQKNIRPGFPNPLSGPMYYGFHNIMTPLTEDNIFRRHWHLIGEHLLTKGLEERMFLLHNFERLIYENARLEQTRQLNYRRRVQEQFQRAREHSIAQIFRKRFHDDRKRKTYELDVANMQENPKRSSRQKCQICHDSGHSTRDCNFMRLPYAEELLPQMVPLIEDVDDTEPDGNCGFRAVAICLRRDQDEFHKIRMEILNEMERHPEFYQSLAERNMKEGYKQTMESLKAPNGPVGEDKWMLMPSLGDAIANTYERPVFFYSKKQSNTFLPNRIKFKFTSSIFLAKVKNDHYVSLRMLPVNIPLPPLLVNWDRTASSTAMVWKAKISKNLELWERIMGPPKKPGPPEEPEVIEVVD